MLIRCIKYWNEIMSYNHIKMNGRIEPACGRQVLFSLKKCDIIVLFRTQVSLY